MACKFFTYSLGKINFGGQKHLPPGPFKCLKVIGLDELLHRRIPDLYEKYKGQDVSYEGVFTEEEIRKINNFLRIIRSILYTTGTEFAVLYLYNDNSAQKIVFKGIENGRLRWSTYNYNRKYNGFIDKIKNGNITPRLTIEI